MTKEELLAAIAALSAEDKAALLGKATKKSTYAIRDLVEITFGAMPDREVKAKLQKAGFHWNPWGKVWYAYYSDEAQALLDELNIKKA